MSDHDSSLAENTWQGQVELLDLCSGRTRPALCAYLLDGRGRPLAITDVAADGGFEVSLSSTGAAKARPRHLAIGPPPGAGRDLPRAALRRWRTTAARRELRLGIAPGDWLPWSSQRRELHGRLLWRPFDNALAARLATIASDPSAGAATAAVALERCLRRHGYPVHEGEVQIYRRWCYNQPPQVDEPRFHDLLQHLQTTAAALPWADFAHADPDQMGLPRLRRELAAFVHEGALDVAGLLAACHLAALRAPDPSARAAHLAAHPQLHCQPGAVTPVASGEIGTDGHFRIRWRELLQLMPDGCHEEFALVVSQSIAGESRVIYDGVRAGQWVAASGSGHLDTLNLISLHADTRCLPVRAPARHNRRPQVRLMSVGELAAGHVLATPHAPDTRLRGLLPLRYRFEPALRERGACYYRVRVTNADGGPDVNVTLLAPAWTRHRKAHGHTEAELIGLGPQTIGDQTGLLRIPYDDEHDWQAGQAHALLDSREFADGPHWVTLELFDDQGRRLTPRDTRQAGEQAAAFDFVSAATATTLGAPALAERLHWSNAPLRRDHKPAGATALTSGPGLAHRPCADFGAATEGVGRASTSPGDQETARGLRAGAHPRPIPDVTHY